MSTSIKNLRQLAARDVKDHTAIFDSYVVLGRDIDYLAIRTRTGSGESRQICWKATGSGFEDRSPRWSAWKKFHARMMQDTLCKAGCFPNGSSGSA